MPLAREWSRRGRSTASRTANGATRRARSIPSGGDGQLRHRRGIMGKVEKIEDEVQALSPPELARFVLGSWNTTGPRGTSELQPYVQAGRLTTLPTRPSVKNTQPKVPHPLRLPTMPHRTSGRPTGPCRQHGAEPRTSSVHATEARPASILRSISERVGRFWSTGSGSPPRPRRRSARWAPSWFWVGHPCRR